MNEREKELVDKYWDKTIVHFNPTMIKELFGTKEEPTNRAFHILEKTEMMNKAASNSGGDL